MRRIATDHRAETDDRIEPAGPGKLAGHQGDFERARHPHHFHRVIRHAGLGQRLHTLGQKPAGHKLIKFARYDAERQPRCVLRPFAKLHGIRSRVSCFMDCV